MAVKEAENGDSVVWRRLKYRGKEDQFGSGEQTVGNMSSTEIAI